MRQFQKRRVWGALVVAAVLAAGSLLSTAMAASKCVTAPHKKPYTIGWADIYLAPTWMGETLKIMNETADSLKAQGVVAKFSVSNANGQTPQQIQQIQSMIDSKVDAIIVDAGSSTALNNVIAKACKAGIAVVNFDSLVTTDQLTTKIDTNQEQWGQLAAEWLVKTLNGKGNIIALNGPAGVSVSEARWSGAKKVLAKYPNIKVVAQANLQYNVAPAQAAATNLLYAHPNVDGILSLGGALSAGAVQAELKAGHKLVPITGENYKQFLDLWNEHKFQGWATAQPNWMGAVAIYAAVKALEGGDVAANINVPLAQITNDNLAGYIERGKQFPSDGYVYPPYTQQSLQNLVNQPAQ